MQAKRAEATYIELGSYQSLLLNFGVNENRECRPLVRFHPTFGDFGRCGMVNISASGSRSDLPSIQTPFLKSGSSGSQTFEVPITAPNPTVTMFSRQAVLRTARAAAPQRTIASQIRTFAAPASSEKVKAPIALFGLDGTYATALVIRLPRPIYIQLGTWRGA